MKYKALRSKGGDKAVVVTGGDQPLLIHVHPKMPYEAMETIAQQLNNIFLDIEQQDSMPNAGPTRALERVATASVDNVPKGTLNASCVVTTIETTPLSLKVRTPGFGFNTIWKTKSMEPWQWDEAVADAIANHHASVMGAFFPCPEPKADNPEQVTHHSQDVDCEEPSAPGAVHSMARYTDAEVWPDSQFGGDGPWNNGGQ